MALGDGIRRNIATVSKEERDRLCNAIIALHKNCHYPGKRDETPAGGVSCWFKQDEIHAHTHVHNCAAFIPWHRELINRFEASIRKIDKDLSLHYWDWTTDPRFQPDGKGGTFSLFTPDFMGNDNGDAGEPWLSAGFYVPNADQFRSDDVKDMNNNPFDPPRTLTRAVGTDPDTPLPSKTDDNDAIIYGSTFREFHTLLTPLHDRAHGFIGGTLSNPHTSFRDPFVFLLHSNMDRLWAMWQLDPRFPERLDPNRVYGKYCDYTKGCGDVMSLHPKWGILSPLEPWAGPEAQNLQTGIICNVHKMRPWAPPENEQNLPENKKDSKHPSVVTPPKYDTTIELPSLHIHRK